MIRIRIKPTRPGAQRTGDQAGHSLFVANHYDKAASTSSFPTHPSLAPVPREQANIEAERGETVMGDFDQDGSPEHFTVGGNRHAEGGTPLQVPDGSFVFSDTRTLKIGGPVLQEFGKSGSTKKKYTPATLAKQYPLNDYQRQSEDPDADPLDRTTAQLMRQNHERKLSKLALVQEALKGFPSGIPAMALPILETGPLASYRQGGPARPVDPYPGDKGQPRKYQREQLGLAKGFNQYATPWLKEYGFSDSPQGLDEALREAGYSGDLTNIKAVQQFLIDANLQRGNQSLFNQLQRSYGMTNQGIQEGFSERPGALPLDKASLEKIYADGKFGVRSGLLLRSLLPKPLRGSPVTVPTMAYDLPAPNVKGLVPQIPAAREAAPISAPPKDDAMPWWTQDVLNLGAAVRNRYHLKKYAPAFTGVDTVLPAPVFMDPARPVAAIQEQGAQQQYLNTLLAGPSQARAAMAQSQGQIAGQAANVLSQVQNQNIGIANDMEGKRTDILNNAALRNAASRKQYQDEWTTLHQQYDNSVQEANEQVRAGLINGMTNAQRTYWLNKGTPQFRLDPATGRIQFTKGKSVSSLPAPAGGTAAGNIETYDQYYRQAKAKGYSDEKAHDWAAKVVFGTRSRFTADSDGDTQMTASGNGINPMALQLLSMYAPQFQGGQ